MHTSWAEWSDVLRLSRRIDRCTVLGPGVRAVVWVQGCPLRCAGCVAPETLPFAGGTQITTEQLAVELAGLPDIEGITFSGGEPMAQAAALVDLIDRVRRRRELSFMAYTGFTIEHLQTHGAAAQRALLDRLDILVDGPYVAARHTDLRWRGSDNQRVHLLTDRYAHLAERLEDRGTWVEIECGRDGTLAWTGIPPMGFRQRFEDRVRSIGVTLTQAGVRS